MITIIFFTAVAGICGTGLGGIISVILFRKSSQMLVCWMLSFAAGVMVSIVCFGLAPEAFELAGIAVSISGLILGVFIIMGLNRIVDKITEIKGDALKVHQTPEELYHESQVIHDQAKFFRSGVFMFTVIALHNIPEGIAIGAGGSYNFQLGVLLAVMISLHNIPEGMAIAAPLLAGGINRRRVIILTALSGAPTLLGGLAGFALGHISDVAVALSLSIAGGAMLYIVFGEIIPQTVVMTKNRTTTIVTLFGIIVGLIVTHI